MRRFILARSEENCAETATTDRKASLPNVVREAFLFLSREIVIVLIEVVFQLLDLFVSWLASRLFEFYLIKILFIIFRLSVLR